MILKVAILVNEVKLWHAGATERHKDAGCILVIINEITTNFNLALILFLERFDRRLNLNTGWSSIGCKLYHDRNPIFGSNELGLQAIASCRLAGSTSTDDVAIP